MLLLLAFVVGGALFFLVLAAALPGFLLPCSLLKIGVDHAPGADPSIITIRDVPGQPVYFILAGWWLGVATRSRKLTHGRVHPDPALYRFREIFQ